MSEIRISLYNGAIDKIGTFTTTAQAIDHIRTGAHVFKKNLKGRDLPTLAQSIKNIRNAPTKAAGEELKKMLPAVTWSGIFTQRNKLSVVSHSGLICMDVDGLKPEQMAEAWPKITGDPFVWAAFISPRGSGYKVIFKTSLQGEKIDTAQKHELCWAVLAQYIKQKFGLEIDPSGKDVSRLCFLSHHTEVYYNPEARSGFDEAGLTIEKVEMSDIPQQQTPAIESKQVGDKVEITIKRQLPKQEPTTGTPTANEAFSKVLKFTEKILVYDAGKRNKFINQCVVNCKEQGIEKEECEACCLAEFHDYKAGPKEIQGIVKSVYGNAKIQFGKHAPKPKKTKGTGAQMSLTSQGLGKYNETILFWYWADKLNKDGDPVTNPKTGEIKTTLCFDHDKITFFLANNGFKQIEIGEGFQFVRIKDNKLEPVRDIHMTAFVMEYLCQNLKTDEAGNYTEVEDELYEVRRMFKRGKKTYCSESALQSLPVFKPNFVRDTEDTAFVYFNNCYVEVTKDGIATKPYTELRGHIWQKQIIDSDFTALDFSKEENTCMFQQFLELAVVGDVDNWEEREEKKFAAAATGIGFMCHGYKDPTNAKAVVTVDGKPRHANDSNGGSGKSLYFKAIGKMTHTCLINGKAFKFDTQYPFGTLQVDHKLAVFNDVKRNFSFEELFHYITEDWDLKRLYEDPIVIPYEDSAKIGVATNFSLQGNSDSFIRRQHIIEFSNYFNAQRDPIQIFKKRFFTHWDQPEWNRFYNFMILCIRKFLKSGLVAYPLENYGINKLRDGMGDEGADWLEDNISDDTTGGFLIGTKYDKSEIYKRFRADLPQYDKVKPNTFTGWVKEWARIKGLQLNAHKPADGIDKSGSTYYWTFTKPVAE